MDGWAQCRKRRVADIGLLVGCRKEVGFVLGGCARRKSGLLNMQIVEKQSAGLESKETTTKCGLLFVKFWDWFRKQILRNCLSAQICTDI